MPDIKVLRTFFIDRKVDAKVARLALGQDKSKNEMMRALLEQGLARLPDAVAAGLEVATDAPLGLDDGDDRGKVLRSIYLPPDFDEAMRTAAFDSRTSKSALMRRFIDDGLSEMGQGELVEARPAPVPPARVVADAAKVRRGARGRVAAEDHRFGTAQYVSPRDKEEPLT